MIILIELGIEEEEEEEEGWNCVEWNDLKFQRGLNKR